MALRLDVTGADRVERVARACEAAHRGGLQRELKTRLESSLRGFEARVRSEMPAAMPDRYAAILAPATKVTIQVTGAWPQVHATAKAGRRHIEAVEGGRLKHPVYGRVRRTRRGVTRSPWVTQPVAGRFFARAVRAYQLNLRRAAELALKAVAERIANA